MDNEANLWSHDLGNQCVPANKKPCVVDRSRRANKNMLDGNVNSRTCGQLDRISVDHKLQRVG